LAAIGVQRGTGIDLTPPLRGAPLPIESLFSHNDKKAVWRVRSGRVASRDKPREEVMRMLKLALAGLCAAALLGFGPARAADPVKIRIAYVVPVANWAPMIEAKKDLAKHLGKSYTLEVTRFQGTPPMITALANGELDIADLAYSTLGLAIENAGIKDLKIIADEFQDGVPGYYSNEFFVRNDSPIKSVKDLKGKVLATNAVGSGIDIAMRAELIKNGLVDKRDYTVIEAPFPTMAGVLGQKRADLVPVVPPFSYIPKLRGSGRVLFTQKDGIGRSQFVVWTARQSFLDKNRAAMTDFMEDVVRIVRWYLDPKNHKEVTEISGKMTKQPPERFDWVFTNKDYYRDPNMVPDLDALQKNVDTAHKLGFLKTRLDISKHADLSIVKEAAKRLDKK